MLIILAVWFVALFSGAPIYLMMGLAAAAFAYTAGIDLIVIPQKFAKAAAHLFGTFFSVATHDRARHLAVQQPERRGTGGGGGTGAGGETGAVAPLALDVALADFGRRLVHAACFCLASAIPSSA